jgi:AraC-like DNA-binding protein
MAPGWFSGFDRLISGQGKSGGSQEAGLSRRRFTQLFREQIGLTPKLYCRVQRFQNALQQIASGASVHWAQLALAAGYCDQAHLAHEFRDFSGLSPGAYLASDRRSANNVSIDRINT